MRLIDANALWKEIISNHDRFIELYDLYELLDSQPTIEPEPKRGKWELYDDGYSAIYKCSVCGADYVPSEYTPEQWLECMRFCPHCGAQMDGDADV